MKVKGGALKVILKVLAKLIPGTYLRTFIYLNVIASTRKILRKSINSFYRIDHIYDVVQEFKKNYKGNFSILEFGVADGYAFTKKLYAVKYLGMEQRVTVHGFDTFEGIPDAQGSADKGLVGGSGWVAGHFKGQYEELDSYCKKKYNNHQLHKGLFDQTLTEEFLETLIENPPMLIWIDCDYYSSTKVVLQALIPYIPTGCVIYFDDIYFNFSSRFTGEMKAVWELNHGEFGEGLELVLDPTLCWDSNRVYRFINVHSDKNYELNTLEYTEDPILQRGDDSPLP